MGRRSKNQAALPLEAPLRVRLTDEDRARKGHELAVIGLSIRGHKRKLTSDTRATKQEIARLEKDRGDLEDALIADEELRPQGELFVGDLPRDEATAALASVAAVAGEVKPSEPHRFEAVGGTGRTGLAGQMCKHCGSGNDDPVHAVAEPSTIACSRCSQAAPKDDIRYDRDVKPVCDPCRRGAIEAGTWLHQFATPPGIGVPSTKTRCRHCKRRTDDTVHDIGIAEEASVVDTNTTPGDTPPAEGVAAAKAHVTGGNGKGKGAIHARTRASKAERKQGKAARA